MPDMPTRCVLLADAHHGLSEGIRRLLATAFDAIVMVADEVSLFESAARLRSELAIVDLTLAGGDNLEFVRRFRARFPDTRMIIISVHDQPSVSSLVLEAGADGFVAKRAIATDLLSATDAVLAGRRYVSATMPTSTQAHVPRACSSSGGF
jgi:DNA-binding NarL/FixJ family response regulator